YVRFSRMERGVSFWLLSVLLSLLFLTSLVISGYLVFEAATTIHRPLFVLDIVARIPYLFLFLGSGLWLWFSIANHFKNGVTRETLYIALSFLAFFSFVILLGYAASHDS
ncbi:MAG: hypothetical protein Q7U74_13580, partial [Saprospiraceae bacterium]|nr:hypothetical protein [Saprospiraceae bacterium]